ncbi:Glucose-1-phosphate thymidylyltransferase [Hyphomicrobium sulfonivorans]|uniref:glucose-1-phosphate thymidylyltransferase n=1 Tax=Hyphomicrobium sulfonivorans TaxID=121290 RepID=A0A120CXH9_HYPSL|nr:sugar phosphate nucleotidyltransferase [Hyphomicrobium sulfonivorans]KWT71005.1 Glucose-1-phosphate thymidylyltransferase [Hyphomicrobium sulfonivorans]
MRGILLAGGRGTRLLPATGVISKQLLPIYDTPMIFHPLALLMEAGVREFMLISTPESLDAFQRLLGDGSQFGISIRFAPQAEPRGIAEALIIADEFTRGEPSTLVLGDNLFLGGATAKLMRKAFDRPSGATVFATPVQNPEAFGIVSLRDDGTATSIEEKPKHSRSNYAVTGLYVYDGAAAAIARAVQPSARGEIEITDVNRDYLNRDALRVELIPDSDTWFDTGTPDSLLEAAQLVQQIERQGARKPGCLEEIAFDAGWIGLDGLQAAANRWAGSNYARHLHALAQRASEIRAAV